MRPKTIIMDLDGTLVDSRHRHHFLTGERGFKNADLWRAETDKDQVVAWCLDLIKGYYSLGYKIIYLTGREEICRETTEEFLNSTDLIKYCERLIMRPMGDNGADHEVKKKIYLETIMPWYQVVLAVDDRPGIAKMWRELGVPCLHCDTWEEDQAKLQKIHETFLEEYRLREEMKRGG